jgi:hypothetical protein
MPILLLPQGPALPSGIDVADVITGILPALGATSFADIADWCTQTELYQWADECSKRLAHRSGIWVDRAPTVTVTAGTATAAVPDGHIDTIHVSLGGTPLRPASALELEALDPSWAAQGTPNRFSMDAAPVGNIRLYPTPSQSGTAAVIYHRFQPTVQAGQSVLPIPSPLGDYVAFSIMAEARRKESDGAMPEMADHFDERVGLYEQLIEHYWGPAR